MTLFNTFFYGQSWARSRFELRTSRAKKAVAGRRSVVLISLSASAMSDPFAVLRGGARFKNKPVSKGSKSGTGVSVSPAVLDFFGEGVAATTGGGAVVAKRSSGDERGGTKRRRKVCCGMPPVQSSFIAGGSFSGDVCLRRVLVHTNSLLNCLLCCWLITHAQMLVFLVHRMLLPTPLIQTRLRLRLQRVEQTSSPEMMSAYTERAGVSMSR